MLKEIVSQKVICKYSSQATFTYLRTFVGYLRYIDQFYWPWLILDKWRTVLSQWRRCCIVNEGEIMHHAILWELGNDLLFLLSRDNAQVDRQIELRACRHTLGFEYSLSVMISNYWRLRVILTSPTLLCEAHTTRLSANRPVFNPLHIFNPLWSYVELDST